MYAKQTWVDGLGGGTPVNATRLTHMEQGIGAAPQMVAVVGVSSTTGTTELDLTNFVVPANTIVNPGDSLHVWATGNFQGKTDTTQRLTFSMEDSHGDSFSFASGEIATVPNGQGYGWTFMAKYVYTGSFNAALEQHFALGNNGITPTFFVDHDGFGSLDRADPWTIHLRGRASNAGAAPNNNQVACRAATVTFCPGPI